MTLTKDQLISEINAFAKAIGNISTWDGTGDVFGHLSTQDEDDYIYEFYCYIALLHDLNESQTVNFIVGHKNGLFPKKPALKKNGWARFDVEDVNNKYKYQACSGTTIKLSTSKTTISPDISFQSADASDDPDENDIVLVLDSKFTSRKGKIDIATIREFVTIINDLEVTTGKDDLRLAFDKLSDLKANCLISNGSVAKDHSDYCSQRNIRQIGKFGDTDPTEVAG